MQANKIKIGAVYAYRHENNKLVRATVRSVTTKRVNDYGNPHDYESTVQIQCEGETKVISVEPKAVLGPYQDHVELVAKKKAQDEENARIAAEKKQRAEDVRMWFYRITKIPVPADRFKQLFDDDYSNNVRINADGVEALWKYMKESKT